MRARRSLRVDLAAALAVVVMMAVVSLSFASEMLAQRRHVDQEQQRLREHAAGLAIVLAPSLVSGTSVRGDVEAVLHASIGSMGIAAIEVHRVLGDDVAPIVSVGLGPDLPRPTSTEASLIEHGGWLVVDQPIRTFGSGDGSRLLLRLVARPTPGRTLAEWWDVAVLAIGVGVVSFVLGVMLLELQVLRPLARLRDRTAEVGGGQLDTRVEIDGPAEVQTLAAAFNEMTEKLAARMREIETQRGRLARAEELASIGRIAAGTAHEVGNPLATMLGYVELLLDPRTDPPLPSEQREMLARVREQTLRIQTLVAQLLEYSRPVRSEPIDVEIAPLVQRTVALARHDARCADVDLRAVVDEEHTVLADPALLEQVLLNLLVNAARAARTGSGPAQVEVRVAALADDRVAIDVHDNGPGVADEVRPRLFEPFFTTAKAGEGTGLGLAISQGLVERMGGTLACLAEPSAIGAGGSPGAVFRVTLPGAAGAKPPANAQDPVHVLPPTAPAELGP